ncbi:hypothetical protein C5L14_23285 [Labrys okinawensis]|uniref:Uncharacterized protein n=1 Tax=Labrys okinawensis TaxID=346911 RepID=A0A2S9Q7N5_9HYPH|nr:hypothetical protein C5L14_23285 [Labrys okinawensis]
MWWIREISSCFKFISITGVEPAHKSKRVYEFFIPVFLSLVFYTFYWLFPSSFSGNILSGLGDKIFQFMVFVVPFHLAALAAFAAFQASGLDDVLPGNHAQLRVWSNQDNGYFYKALTLRQYISLLFGYLCSIGIFYILVYLIVSNINIKFEAELYNTIFNNALLIFIVFFIIHYVTLTIYSITFLFDKVNRVDSP